MSKSFLQQKAEGEYILYIRLTPGAKQESIQGVFCDENSQEFLKVYTTVIPEDNKANKQLIKIVAKKIGVAKSNISLIQGGKSRFKTLLIQTENKLSKSLFEID